MPCEASPSLFSKRKSWRSSAPMALAKQHCFAQSQGLHRPSAGRLMFDGDDIGHVRAHQRVRKGIALVPEGRRLFPGLTVEENLRVAGEVGREGEWTLEKVLDAFPLLRDCFKRRGRDLSGGQQQATSIGRALMTNPRLLLLDEVSLGLAPIAVEHVYESLRAVIASGATIVLVEQELDRALKVATRIMCMLEGRIVLEGATSELTREQITEAYFGLREERRVH